MERLKAEKTALVVIDVQDGIVKNGQLLPISGEQIIKVNNQLIQQFRAEDALIVLVNVDITTFKYLSEKYQAQKPAASYMNYSTAVAEDLNAEKVVKITKHNPGAFFGTDLDLQLRRRGIDTIVLTGVATGNGVYATAIDAFQQGYHLITVADACSDRDGELHQVVVEKMLPKLGEVVNSSELKFK